MGIVLRESPGRTTQSIHRILKNNVTFWFFFSVYIFFCCCTAVYEILGQGSNQSSICDLSHNCGNTRSSTHYAGLVIESVSQCSQDTADPIVPQWELQQCHLFIFLCLFVVVAFLGPYQQHMEVPRLGTEMKLHLPACATATAMPDLSCVCDLHQAMPNPQPTEWGQGLNLCPHGY